MRIEPWIKLSCSFATCALIYILIILFWGINRGFDPTDEGFYLLLAKHPHEYQLISSVAVWLACIPSFTVSRVLDFRYAQIICQILGSIWLAYAYLRALAKLDVLRNRVLLIGGGIFSLIGNLMLFAKFPFSISYNSLTGLLLFGATALIIDTAPFVKPFWVQSLQGAKKRSLMLIGSGMLTGLCFSLKFSACLAFTISALPLILIISGRGWRMPAAAYLLGVFLSFIFMCSFLFNPADYWKSIQLFMSYQAQHRTLHSSLLTNYWLSIKLALEYFQPYLLPTAIFGFASFFFLAYKRKDCDQRTWSKVSVLLHVVVCCTLGFGLIKTDSIHHNYFSANVFFVICIVFFCEIAGLYFGQGIESKKRFQWRAFVLNFVLLLLPVLISVGTSNGLPFQCSIYLTPTFLLLFGLSAILNKQLKSKLPTIVTLTACSILAMTQFYDGFVVHPYGIQSRLSKQTERVGCKNLRGLRLAPEQAKFIDDTQKILQASGYREDDDVLAFYNLPGLVYAIDGNSPALGWFLSFPAYREWNRQFLKKLVLTRKKRLFLIIEWKLDESILDGMTEAGVKFPNDFKLLGSLHNPLVLGSLDGVPDKNYMNGQTDIYELIQK